jgi:uncharacterized protein
VQDFTRSLVTGASTGIGAAIAVELASRGSDLVLVARSADKLEALGERLTAEHGVDVEVLPADLTDADQLATVEARLREDGDGAVDLLVNNAGFGAAGGFESLPLDRQQRLVELNVTALVRLTHAALDQLRGRRTGGVINVGSTAGFQPDPYSAVYGASKAFVRSFTEAIHDELRGTGVRAMVLAPGIIETEFQEVAGVHLHRLTSATVMPVEPVVEQAPRDFARGRSLCVPGLVNRVAAHGASLSPSVVSRRASALVHRDFADER